jgi:hypothetical protein
MKDGSWYAFLPATFASDEPRPPAYKVRTARSAYEGERAKKQHGGGFSPRVILKARARISGRAPCPMKWSGEVK